MHGERPDRESTVTKRKEGRVVSIHIHYSWVGIRSDGTKTEKTQTKRIRCTKQQEKRKEGSRRRERDNLGRVSRQLVKLT